MAKQDWAPAPWELENSQWLQNKDGSIRITSPWREDAWEDGEASANMERIIACVNACAGVPTEDLECLPVKKLMEVYPMFDKVLAQSKTILAQFKEAPDDSDTG